MNLNKSIAVVKLIHQFTKNVIVVGSQIIIDNVSFDTEDYLRNHFSMDRILYKGDVLTIEEFITC